jgi:hypothetical protein
LASGTSSHSISSRFGGSATSEDAQPGQIAAGVRKAGDEALRDGVDAHRKDDRDLRGCVFGSLRRWTTTGDDHIDLAGDEIRGQRRQPLKMILGPAGFDDNVLSVNIAVFSQSLPQCVNLIGERSGRGKMEKGDHRHRLLLCAYSRTRRGDHGTA